MTLDGTSTKSPTTASKKANHDDDAKAVYGNNLRITVAANQGGRKYMEDRVQIETFRDADGNLDFTFLGVYDGHGGFEASEFVRKHLMTNIINNENFHSDNDNDIIEAIRTGFLLTHHQMWKVFESWPRTASGYSSTAGTTASVAIIRNGKLYTGHVGDSAIILGKATEDKTSVMPVKVTIDHKPESEAELTRIQDAGGQVLMKSGVNRVVWTRPLRGHTGPVRRSTPTENIPFLAVARSLGDLWSYCEATKEFVVSPDPDCCVTELDDSYVCLVLCSDGLTNVMEAYSTTCQVDDEDELSKRLKEDTTHLSLMREKHPNHARGLLSVALKNWKMFRADNISAIVAIFDPPEVDIPRQHVSIEDNLDLEQSVDEVFCLDPECMVRVASRSAQKLATFRTPLIYQGALDLNFSSVDYRGPGFLTHDEEQDLEARYASTPNGALSPKTPEREEKPTENVSPVIQTTPEKKTIFTPSARVSRSAKRILTTSPEKEKLRTSFGRLNTALKNNTPVSKLTPVLTDAGNDSDEEEPKEQKKKSPTVPQSTSPVSRRVTRSSGTPRKEARVMLTPTRRSGVVKTTEKVMSPTTFVQISVKETESDNYGVITRSRDRQTTVVVGVMESPTRTRPTTPLSAFRTPQTSKVTSSKLTASRKRPHQLSIESTSTGTTPFVNKMSITSPCSQTPRMMRSAPTTPMKPSDSVTSLNGSKWSLSKLDQLRDEVSDHQEPPSKMRRIYGFMRRLVGFGGPAAH